MGRITILVAAGLSIPTLATAGDLVSIRPGLMCGSADALARLTLPNGDSRSHAVAPRPQDMALAAAGHCIDLQPGRIVTLVTARRNTSIVTEREQCTPLVVPNIDLQPVADGMSPTGGGYSATQHLPTGADGEALEIFEDARITPDLRHQLWGQSSDPEMVLDPKNPLLADLQTHPLLPARLRLVDGSGRLIAGTTLDRPMAMVMPAPFDGLPAPAFLLIVDYGAGTGDSGPATTILMPSLQKLTPLQAGQPPATIELASTLKASWSVVPPRSGPTQEIEFATCQPIGSKPDFVTTYSTYRFSSGAWHVASRRINEYTEFEASPARSLFP